MPPQKKSKKNAPAQANRDDRLPTQGNETSFVPESSNITDQERREKLEAHMKARAEKTAHTQEQPAEQQEFENVDDDDDSIDTELAMVQQKIQQLQKERKVRSSVAGEEKNLRKARAAEQSKRAYTSNTERN
jgi:hypothetical protein